MSWKVRDLGAAYLGGSGSVFHEADVKLLHVLQHSYVFIGPRGPAFNLTHVIDCRPQLLTTWGMPDVKVDSPQSEWSEKERVCKVTKKKPAVFFMTSLRRDTPSLLPPSTVNTDQVWQSVGGDYPRTWGDYTGGTACQGPPWRLITTVLVVKKTALSNEGNLRSCVYVGIVVLSSYTGTIYKDVCKEKKDHKGIKTTLEAETVITPYTQGPRGGRGCWNFEGERIMDSRPTLREADVRRHGQPCAWTCRELTATTFL